MNMNVSREVVNWQIMPKLRTEISIIITMSELWIYRLSKENSTLKLGERPV